MNDSACWAGPLTLAERLELASRACPWKKHDGAYSFAGVIAAAEYRNMRRGAAA